MITSSNIAKLSALSLALAAHAALGMALVKSEPTLIEGATGAAEVRLGNAFADMATGTMTAQPAKDATPAPQPAMQPATQTAAMVRPVQPATPGQPIKHQQAAPAPDAVLPLAAQPATPTEALKPETSTAITGAAPETAAVSRSLRPQLRDPERAAEHKPKPKPTKTAKANTKAKPKPAAKATKGNAQRNARAGESTGTKSAKAKTSGNGGKSKAAGNAAVSNYPGLVMRKLSRAGKPRVNARGSATVAFSIASSGGLSSARIARSSGSAKLDQAALRIVKSAAPYPRPPSGARRSFSVQIKGR
ncbi:MAG: TonB family protein [Paracoccaceae bacterium]